MDKKNKQYIKLFKKADFFITHYSKIRHELDFEYNELRNLEKNAYDLNILKKNISSLKIRLGFEITVLLSFLIVFYLIIYPQNTMIDFFLSGFIFISLSFMNINDFLKLKKNIKTFSNKRETFAYEIESPADKKKRLRIEKINKFV